MYLAVRADLEKAPELLLNPTGQAESNGTPTVNTCMLKNNISLHKQH